MKTITLYSLDDKLSFGKHKGYSIHHIIHNDPQYLDWCIANIDGFKLDKDAKAEAYNRYLDEQSEIQTRSKFKKLSKNKDYWSHPDRRQDDADFASCFDWGSQ